MIMDRLEGRGEIKENKPKDFSESKIKEFYTFKKTRFTLQILYRIATYYLQYLKKINKETDKAESESDIIDDGYPLYVWSFEKNYFHFAKELTDALIRQADYFKGESGELPVKVLDSLPFKAGFLSLDIASNG